VGAVAGSLIIGMLDNGLVLLGVDPSLQIVVKGLIIWRQYRSVRKCSGRQSRPLSSQEEDDEVAYKNRNDASLGARL